MKIEKVKWDGYLPEGFESSGINCGIKKDGKLDLGLVFAAEGMIIGSVFTKNKLKAASLKVSMEFIKEKRGKKAFLVNSGNANCAVGRNGILDSKEILKNLSKKLKCKMNETLLFSTGKIGVRLPKQKIINSVPKLIKKLNRKNGKIFAESIMTTDTFPKYVCYNCKYKNKSFKMVGIAKGAGMIQPDMATMLAFVFTDASVGVNYLNEILKDSVKYSFNRINVDGCMSTNDSVLVCSSGKADFPKIKKEEKYLADSFRKTLNLVLSDLAMMIIEDGEGATKVIKIEVEGAKSEIDAKKVCYAVANSNLFKCSIYGKNPGWGRIYASVGASGAFIIENRMNISVCEIDVFKKGVPNKYDKVKMKKKMEEKNIFVKIALGVGKAGYCIWTNDLTPKYIKINEG